MDRRQELGTHHYVLLGHPHYLSSMDQRTRFVADAEDQAEVR